MVVPVAAVPLPRVPILVSATTTASISDLYAGLHIGTYHANGDIYLLYEL